MKSTHKDNDDDDDDKDEYGSLVKNSSSTTGGNSEFYGVQQSAMNELVNLYEQFASMPESLAPEQQRLPINFIEAKSIVYRCMTTLGKQHTWFPSHVDYQVGLALEELERKMDKIITLFGTGAIVRINNVSCKDVHYRLNKELYPVLQEEIDRLNFEHLQRRHHPEAVAEYYVPSDAGYSAAEDHAADHHMRDNREKAAFFNATHRALRVTNGKDALALLLKSFRIAKELGMMIERHDDEFTRRYGIAMAPDATERGEWDSQHCTHIQIRKWIEGDLPEREFRCFIFNNQIAAVSQLYFPAYFPFVETHRLQIIEAVSRFHAKIEGYLNIERCYSMDITFVTTNIESDLELTTKLSIQVIDISHYTRGVSACLFEAEELEKLKEKVKQPNFEFELRWTTKEISKTTPKEKFISPYWIEHMKVGHKPLEASCSYGYISEGLIEMANDFGMKCSFM